MKRLLLVAFVVALAKIVYDLTLNRRSSERLPDGAPYEPAPEPSGTVTASAPTTRDDLTTLKGIGPVYAGKLEALGITTFAALASADTKVLAGSLSVPTDTVAGWQAQARSLRA